MGSGTLVKLQDIRNRPTPNQLNICKMAHFHRNIHLLPWLQTTQQYQPFQPHIGLNRGILVTRYVFEASCLIRFSLIRLI